MKIYILLGCLIVAILIYAFKIHTDKAFLEVENGLILEANKELNLTLEKVLNEKEKSLEILQKKHEKDLQNLAKKNKVIKYVEKSSENNLTRLFNDTILQLQ